MMSANGSTAWLSTTSLAAMLLLLAGKLHGQDAPDSGVDGCAAEPELRLLRELHFGDLRVQPREDGYVTVTPQGDVLAAGTVLVRSEPQPGELALCGPAYAAVVLEIAAPETTLDGEAGPPVARILKEIVLGGEGMDLERRGPGIWRGELPESGQAVIRLGGTLELHGGGSHGMANAALVVNVYLE